MKERAIVTEVLPEQLSTSFVVAPLSSDDVDEVFALLTADRLAVVGASRLPREAVRIALAPEWPSTTWGVRTQGGLVQVWDASLRPGETAAFAAVDTHPGLVTDADRDALESAGWRHLFRWAADHVPDPGTAQMRTWRPSRDVTGRERLRGLGFVEERVLWVMEASVDDERPAGRPPPDGLSIHAAAEPGTVHAIFMSGFAGTFNFAELSFDDFVASRSGIPGYDPALWFLASIGGRPAGAMTVTRAAPERGAMHVSELAVLPGCRGRGVATSLLYAAFEATRAEGMRLLYLFVDSESEDDAPTLYASVGFEVVQANIPMVRPLRLAQPADGKPR